MPLQILSDDTVLWVNPIPNSPTCLRPVFLIREKETDTEMLNYVIPLTDAAREKLNKYGIDYIVNETNLHIDIEIKDTMKDLKFKKLISGLGGADCIICETKQEDWSNEEKIIEGFQITRTNIDTITLYQELVDDSGSIKKKGS